MGIIDNLGSLILPQLNAPCHMLDEVTGNPDGAFGINTSYVEGAAFDALIKKNTSTEVTVAEVQGARRQYIIGVDKRIELRHGKLIRRDSDGLVLRVTGQTADSQLPNAATLPIAWTTAEEWTIP